jgi:tetratricopeptide (TPR) repeat protein
MVKDRFGNQTSAANSSAVSHLDAALDCFLFFNGSIPDEINLSLQADPNFVLARALQAYIGVLGTEPNDANAARESFLNFQQPSTLEPRERLHLKAAESLLEGDFLAAGRILEEITISHPRDLLALGVGHQIDFFTGNSRMLRDRPAQAIAAWSEDDPNYSNVLGMLAFGLEECHQHDRALELGLDAVERNPKDVWALHAVGHTFEETGRFDDGMGYYDARASDWTTGNYFLIHNWWHYALFALEAGNIARVHEIFNTALFTSTGSDLALELLDATALLWRLKLEGYSELERFKAVASRWLHKTEPAFYAFNDMHMTMAFVGAGLELEAQNLIESREQWLKSNPNPRMNNVAMTREIGLPVCKAILEFGRGNYGRVIEHLFPIRRRIHEFGGSHAQRDAVLKTLIEAALRDGRYDLARAILSERISVRPRSPYNWLKHAAALEGLGEVTKAALARETAKKRLKQV